METIIRRATTGAMAVAVALGLALGAVGFTPDGADARARVPSGGDSLQRGCRSLQDQAQALVDEYADEDTTGARKKELKTELQNIGRTWNEIGCRAVFGDIFLLVPDVPPFYDASVMIATSSTVGAYR